MKPPFEKRIDWPFFLLVGLLLVATLLLRLSELGYSDFQGDELFVVPDDGMFELARGDRSPANLRTRETRHRRIRIGSDLEFIVASPEHS